MNVVGNGIIVIDDTADMATLATVVAFLNDANLLIDPPVKYPDEIEIGVYYKGVYDECLLDVFKHIAPYVKEITVDFWGTDDVPYDNTYLELSLWRVSLYENEIKEIRFFPVLGNELMKMKGETNNA